MGGETAPPQNGKTLIGGEGGEGEGEGAIQLRPMTGSTSTLAALCSIVAQRALAPPDGAVVPSLKADTSPQKGLAKRLHNAFSHDACWHLNFLRLLS